MTAAPNATLVGDIHRRLLEEPGGASRHAALKAGVSYAKSAGVEHDVINDNPFPFVFVEVEIKSG